MTIEDRVGRLEYVLGTLINWLHSPTGLMTSQVRELLLKLKDHNWPTSSGGEKGQSDTTKLA